MKKSKTFSTLLFLAMIFILLSWLMPLFSGSRNAIPYSRVVELFRNEQVESFVAGEDYITMKLREPLDGKTEVTAKLADRDAFRAEMQELISQQQEAGVLKSYDFLVKQTFSPYSLILPLLIAGMVLLIVWFFLAGRVGGSNPMANFGRARTVLGLPDNGKVTFDDVAGAEEEKEELRELVDFLRNPEKFNAAGARIPHGVLLVGPPGTGKTLLARAVAGEADVQFLSISGSDFVEMYVGVGASRVRDLFDQAKKMAPTIIFIDEIDAVGRKRGSGMGGGHDEKEQTLNQMLVEMDGFTRNQGVIVLAATNRPDILDPALLRPGRFDRQVYVGLPDAKGREEILKVHARNKKLDGEVNLKTIAMATSGFTGADLSNMLNEAAILAARRDHPVIGMEELDEAIMKVVAGPEKRSRVQRQKDLRTTAIHEAGHAVAMFFLPNHDPVRQISIIPRGQALGVTWSMPKDDGSHMTRNEMYEKIVALLGGRVAEDLFLDDISAGASNDIDRATKLARDMVGRYGMSEKVGAVSYLSDEEIFVGRDFERTKGYSEKVAGILDDEVKTLIDKAYQHCKGILSAHSEKLQQVVDFLMAHETMSGKQFAECMEGKPISGDGHGSLFDDFQAEE